LLHRRTPFPPSLAFAYELRKHRTTRNAAPVRSADTDSFTSPRDDIDRPRAARYDATREPCPLQKVEVLYK